MKSFALNKNNFNFISAGQNLFYTFIYRKFSVVEYKMSQYELILIEQEKVNKRQPTNENTDIKFFIFTISFYLKKSFVLKRSRFVHIYVR